MFSNTQTTPVQKMQPATITRRKRFLFSRESESGGDHREHCLMVCASALAKCLKRFQDSCRNGGPSKANGRPKTAQESHTVALCAYRIIETHEEILANIHGNQGAYLILANR